MSAPSQSQIPVPRLVGNTQKPACVTFVCPYIPLGWGVVEPAGVEGVAGVLRQLGGVEDGEDGAQRAAVPVVCHPAPVVTLASHVADGVERHILPGATTRKVFNYNP